MTHSALPKGGLLSLDWGQKKVGVATTDEMGLVVTPQRTFLRKEISETWELCPMDIKQLRDLLEEFEPGALVLGLPKNTRGEEREAALGARQLGEGLRKAFGLEVFLVDEVLTSWNAKGKKDEDAAAAATLLEDFLQEQKRANHRQKVNP
jgi:putative Holliday junction resolvase